MSDKDHTPRDIHLLTTDALLADLIAGFDISLGEGKLLSLNSDDARSVLDWYRRNRSRWAGNLSAGDVEAIVDMIGVEPSSSEAASTPTVTGSAQVLRLVKLVAHRFAGLHVHGRATDAPDVFVFEPEKAVTLLEGANGSGKTSIANAIVWCLTGFLIRSQREPEAGPTEFDCAITSADGSVSTHPISAVTPMPHSNSDLPTDSVAIAADTWVELIFADSDGNQLQPIRRQQTRNTRGKLLETATDLGAYPLDPIAWRIATTMPALLPYLPLGATSQLGQAVARLTGLADLVDLAKHAGKASERISSKLTKELETQRGETETQYSEATHDLAEAVGEFPDMASEMPVPAVGSDTARSEIETIADHFATRKAEALALAQGVLGADFDPEDKMARDNLEASVRPAIENVSKITELAGWKRLSALQVDKDALSKTTALLAQIEAEAATLGELAANPPLARRTQLYARISAWMHEHDHKPDKCPVCIGKLEGAADPVTGRAVTEHLEEASQGRDVISKTIADWSSHWCGQLVQELPERIGAEVRTDLPENPINLAKKGLVDDLFASAAFKGALASLREENSILVNSLLEALPAFEEPTPQTLPTGITEAAAPLQKMLTRVARTVAFAEWRAQNEQRLDDIIQALQNKEEGAPTGGIGRRLAQLLAIVEGVSPLNRAIGLVQRLETQRSLYTAKQARIDACGKAVSALALLIPLGKLAQTQVETLQKKLHSRTAYWRDAMFRNATDFAPDLIGTGMDAKGVLELKVGRDGVTAPMQHVSNASALRGALLGFFLAFREHVLTTRGGLALLVLDDPQELLDNDNRERLARGLSRVANEGAQLIVTTHDRKFARAIVSESRSDDEVQHLSVHPVNSIRPTLVLSPAIEEVDRKRHTFIENIDSAPAAQDYAADLRVFLEARLGDLFDNTANPAYATSSKAPTLIPLLDKFKGMVSTAANELFVHPIVRKFAEDKALADSAEPRRILNESHHDKASITYKDVRSVQGDFARLRTDIELVHQQFRLYRWREPMAPGTATPATIIQLQPVAAPSFSVPLCPDIAAFVASAPDDGSQDTPTEAVDGSWFADKAYYYIRGETLGFAIPSGSVAIVETEPYAGRDLNLVIARNGSKIYARRMATAPGGIGISLSAQVPDPRKRVPTITCEEGKVRLHRVAGAIFTDMPPPTGKGEAVSVESVPEIDNVMVAYRVKEDSAVPLALPGQVILCGDKLKPSDLDAFIGELVAVTTTDGASIFKRIGEKLPGGLSALRQFETIGGLGSSVVIATEEFEGMPPVPTMVSARKVIAVLYDGV